MRLNAWQRLLVVVTIAWSLGVAIVAWQVWPIKPKNLRPLEQDFHALARDRGQSLEGSQPSLVSYYAALAAESGGAMARPRFDPTRSAHPIIGYDPDSGKMVHSGAPPVIRVVPEIGRVAFPNWMKPEEIGERASDLDELRKKNDRGLREEYRTRRASATKVLVLAWLAPPIVFYVFSWSIAWIRRGFST